MSALRLYVLTEEHDEASLAAALRAAYRAGARGFAFASAAALEAAVREGREGEGAQVVLLRAGGERSSELAAALREARATAVLGLCAPGDEALAAGFDDAVSATEATLEARLHARLSLLLRVAPARYAGSRFENAPLLAQLDDFVAGLPVVLFRAWLTSEHAAAFEYVGRSSTSVLGRDPEWFYEDGARALRLVHEDDRKRVLTAFSRSAADGCDARVEYRIRTPGGRLRWVQQHATFVGSSACGLRGWAGVLLDVTERKELEAQLHLADRLSSVGTLAAGVAHEINNPLAFVQGNVAVALERVAAATAGYEGGAVLARLEAEEVRAALSDALEGCARMRDTVADLRAFSRAEAQADEVVDLQRVLDIAVRMTRNEARHRARLLELRGPVPPVRGTEARLGQVFVNLLVNALQALPERPVNENELSLRTYVRGGMACVEVRDNGVGIAPEHRERIFEPFFTTKPAGVGTGLGLAVCQGIVEALGGAFEVESAVGVGSVFRVLLPAVPALHGRASGGPSTPSQGLARGASAGARAATGAGVAASASARAPGWVGNYLPSALREVSRSTPSAGLERPRVEAERDRGAAASAGGGATAGSARDERPRLLLIDDEPLVLAALRRLLSRDYAVRCCEGGAAALAALAEPGSEGYAAVLCDLMMPGLSGHDVYEAIARAVPALEPRFLLLTGGAFAPGLESFARALGERTLAKPLELARLRARLAALGVELGAASVARTG